MSQKSVPPPKMIALGGSHASDFIDAVKVDDQEKMIAALRESFKQNGWSHAIWASLAVPIESSHYHLFWPIATFGAFNCFSMAIEEAFAAPGWGQLQEDEKINLIARFLFAAAEYHDQRAKVVGDSVIDSELGTLFELFFAKDGQNAIVVCQKLKNALPSLLHPGASIGSERVHADFETRVLAIFASQSFAQALGKRRI